MRPNVQWTTRSVDNGGRRNECLSGAETATRSQTDSHFVILAIHRLSWTCLTFTIAMELCQLSLVLAVHRLSRTGLTFTIATEYPGARASQNKQGWMS